MKKAFADFLHRLPFYGLAVLCADDGEVAELARATPRRALTYGLSEGVDVRASDVRQEGARMRFDLHLPRAEGQGLRAEDQEHAAGKAFQPSALSPQPSIASSTPIGSGRDVDSIPVVLNLPGVHNVRNALAAAAVGWQLGIAAEAIVHALGEFQGVGRRFQLRGDIALDKGTALLIDDYGHHPRELAAVFAAARGGWPGHRLAVVFQPAHRYTRTRDLLDDFANVLAEVDVLMLTEIYPAGEAPIARRRRTRAGAALPLRCARQGRSGADRASARNCQRPAGAARRWRCAAAARRRRYRRSGQRAGCGRCVEEREDYRGERDRTPANSAGSPSSWAAVPPSVTCRWIPGRNVLDALKSRGVDAHAIDGIPALLDALRAGHFARVFNILHGRGGEDGVLQGALQSLGVPVTGSGVLGSALSMDKIRTKQVWQAIGLPTPRYVRHRISDDVGAAIATLGLPVVVKPSHEGSSVGITRVRSLGDLPAAVELAARYDGELVVEQMIEGEEYTVGILQGRALPVDPHRAGRQSFTTTTPSTSPRIRSTSAPDSTKTATRKSAHSRSAPSRPQVVPVGAAST